VHPSCQVADSESGREFRLRTAILTPAVRIPRLMSPVRTEIATVMNYRPLVLLLGLIAALGSPVHAQVPPEKALSTFTVADGLEISLWASEPLFSNPTCIDVDHKGRIWVCESVNYRHTLRGRPPRRPEGDRILILEDTHGTGKADKVTTFYQSKETLAPLGIAVAKDPVGPGYKVYVCQSPDILLFEDRDGDGKADGPPKKLLSGFRGIDHDHGVHGILIGPDRKLYFSVGDQGVRDLRSSDGKGRKWTTNHTDCQGGTIWRCDLDGTNLELIAYNFRNEYEPCVDSFGTIFVSDNDDDGNEQTRICYVMPGGNYGYWPRGPGQSHWHEEQPGVVPKILRTYFGSPTGMCVYEGTLLPRKYWSQPLHTDAGPRQARCYRLTPQGASYAVDREDFVTSTDNWFRPSDICVAPDGSLFLADWYDPGVGGHGMGDTARGRIFRVAPKGNKPFVPSIDLESKEGLAKALASPALSVRYLAMAKLRDMDRSAFLAELQGPLAQTKDPVLRARALWQLGCQYREAKKHVAANASANAHELASLRQAIEEHVRSKAANDKDPRFRALAIRLLRDCLGQTPADYDASEQEHVLKDPSPMVRSVALLALRDSDPAKSKHMIMQLAKQYDGKDRFYLEAIGIAAGHDPARREILLAGFEEQFPQWSEKVANLVWELRPPQVLPRLEKRLFDTATPTVQRAQIVDIVASSADASGGKVLLQVLRNGVPDPVRDRILATFRQFLPGNWRELRQSPELAQTLDRLLELPDSRTTALALIDAATRTDYLDKVCRIAGDSTESPATRAAAVQTLGFLPAAAAVAALEAFLKTEPPERRVAVVEALGHQAQPRNRRMGFGPPPGSGFRPFGPGRQQAGPALKILENLVKASDQDPLLKQAAVGALAGTRSGSLWLLEAHDKKELPEGLNPVVARLVRNSPYPDLRKRALSAFPPPSKLDPKKLPDIAFLAKRRGDAVHGKRLIAASLANDHQCLKCHTIEGVGGKVGPDLSVIGTKASRENLFESILYPSKAIADQYLTWVVETKGGVVVSGLLVEETSDHITLRDANAKDTRISKSEIETRVKSQESLMPNNLLAYMTEDDLVDMVEYLFSLKSTQK
jgi:putative membrane-bound dehydrogenase-like protein